MNDVIIDRLLELDIFTDEEKVEIVRNNKFISKVYAYGYFDASKNM